MPTSIDYVEINGTFRRKIKLEWENCSITNKFTKKSVIVKKNSLYYILARIEIKANTKRTPLVYVFNDFSSKLV